MATPQSPGLPVPPEKWSSVFGRTLQVVVNNLLQGKLNCTGSVTLTAGATSTTLTDTRIGGTSKIFFSPTTANAAVATANLFVASLADGSATLTHSNTGTTDRIFSYAVIG